MNNNNNIEENIKILKNITKQDFNNPMGWSGYYDSELKELQQAIESILADRERREKENDNWEKYNLEKEEEITQLNNKLVEAEAKANKYDSLVEKIKNKIKEKKKLKKHYWSENTIRRNFINADIAKITTEELEINDKHMQLSGEVTILQELLDTIEEKK